MDDKVKVKVRAKVKGFMHGFKDFITKGNVVDMAIGVIIGGAFGKIITSLVNDIIMPPIGVLLGGVDFKDLKALIHQTPLLDDAGNQIIVDGVAQFDKVYIQYGNFIQIILEFLIIAFAIYFALFFLIRRKQLQEQLVAQELAKMEAEKTEAEQAAAEAQAQDEPIVPEIPVDIQLLTEIRDLLKKENK
ncbi:large conductance mechanosensitive channel protein MscL [Acholeplasma hippikon]|uniref:Large-conductance mechanosensitive channel n=1 Tax=Acholeplasma hippikon TaxID=264636 RepID=A0A449BKA9_9MOLU|nr:large conductance mechanosensitive channel protein MscL [Acholeplasma hippikon]VEU82878.1 large-conductance mechanosensitive channel [Acholeplasma hippikon]